MHFLAMTAEKHYPDAIDFADELLHVEKATRGTVRPHNLLLYLWLTSCINGHFLSEPTLTFDSGLPLVWLFLVLFNCHSPSMHHWYFIYAARQRTASSQDWTGNVILLVWSNPHHLGPSDLPLDTDRVVAWSGGCDVVSSQRTCPM